MPGLSATSIDMLTRYAWLSIAAAVVTIAMKTIAFTLTGAVGLLSDALESLVNLVAAILALAMLILASRPPTSGTRTATPKPSTSRAVPRGR